MPTRAAAMASPPKEWNNLRDQCASLRVCSCEMAAARSASAPLLDASPGSALAASAPAPVRLRAHARPPGRATGHAPAALLAQVRARTPAHSPSSPLGASLRAVSAL